MNDSYSQMDRLCTQTYEQLKKRVKSFEFADPHNPNHIGPTFSLLVSRLSDCIHKHEDADVEIVKARVLLSEVHDYFGRFSDAAELSAPGANILDSLTAAAPPYHKAEINAAVASVRLAVAHARTLYRQNNYGQAHELLAQCRKYVDQTLKNDMNPLLGTRGEIAYLAGRVLRQRQRLQEALAEFDKSIDLYDRRGHYKSQTDSARAREQTAFSAYKCGTILALGTGWTNYNSGAISRAMSENLIPARIILRNSGDVLNKAYSDVIYASALRAFSTEYSKSLDRARTIVRDAASLFEKYEHAHYAAGAYVELALIDLAKDDLERVVDDIRALDRHAAGKDYRWACSAQIILSRLERRKARLTGSAEHMKAAEQHAINALAIAMAHDEPLGIIDALIARSEAFFAQDNISGLDDLNEALRLNRSSGLNNPKVEALCRLHLARYHLDRNDFHAGIANYREWQVVAPLVEHARLHAMARDIESRFNIDRVFVIDTSKDGLNLADHQKALRRFLIEQAKLHKSSKAEQAAALGISRQALDKSSKIVPDANETPALPTTEAGVRKATHRSRAANASSGKNK